MSQNSGGPGDMILGFLIMGALVIWGMVEMFGVEGSIIVVIAGMVLYVFKKFYDSEQEDKKKAKAKAEYEEGQRKLEEEREEARVKAKLAAQIKAKAAAEKQKQADDILAALDDN